MYNIIILIATISQGTLWLYSFQDTIQFCINLHNSRMQMIKFNKLITSNRVCIFKKKEQPCFFNVKSTKYRYLWAKVES